MICPRCHSYTFFIKESEGKNAFCESCNYQSRFIQPSYDSYQEKTYGKTVSRNENNDPLIKKTISILNIKSSDVVLEYGSGPGHLSAAMSRHTKHVVGLDIDISLAQANYPNLSFKKQRANSKLKIDNDSVDIVVCVNTIEHVANFDLLLKEFRRIMKPNGKLFICTPDHGFFIRFPDATHVIEWDKVGFKKLIAKYFDVDKAFNYGSFFNYYPFNKLIVKILKPEQCMLASKRGSSQFRD